MFELCTQRLSSSVLPKIKDYFLISKDLGRAVPSNDQELWGCRPLVIFPLWSWASPALCDSRWPQHAFMLGQMLLIYDQRSRWQPEITHPTSFPRGLSYRSWELSQHVRIALVLIFNNRISSANGNEEPTFYLHFQSVYKRLHRIFKWAITHLNTGQK